MDDVDVSFEVEDKFAVREGFSRLIIDSNFFDVEVPRQLVNYILNDENEKIYLIMNSEVGCIFNLIVLLSLLKKYKHVVAINLAAAYSAAGMLFFLADERYIPKEGIVMLHQYRTDISGDMVDINSYNKAMNNLFTSLFKRMGRKVSIRENYFLGEDLIKSKEALELTGDILRSII